MPVKVSDEGVADKAPGEGAVKGITVGGKVGIAAEHMANLLKGGHAPHIGRIVMLPQIPSEFYQHVVVIRKVSAGHHEFAAPGGEKCFMHIVPQQGKYMARHVFGNRVVDITRIQVVHADVGLGVLDHVPRAVRRQDPVLPVRAGVIGEGVSRPVVDLCQTAGTVNPVAVLCGLHAGLSCGCDL